MKTINLYFDFEFTSLSPDARPISLGIVSGEVEGGEKVTLKDHLHNKGRLESSFYAEFNDFDINRCDDWVKENVVSKLKYTSEAGNHAYDDMPQRRIKGNTGWVKDNLSYWLDQFHDYQIQFVCDCGTWDWYWMLQLLAEWDIKQSEYVGKYGFSWNTTSTFFYKSGLPKLPVNISPVPQDLNDLIAIKKGISVKEAFELNRETLTESISTLDYIMGYSAKHGHCPKHNALWDAKVIKAIYNNLK